MFAFSANFVHASGCGAESFGFTFGGALSKESKRALAPLRSGSWSWRSWRSGSWRRSWRSYGRSYGRSWRSVGVQSFKFSFVGANGSFSLNVFNGSTEWAFDEASLIGRRSREAESNFASIANLVWSVGATCDGVHVVGIFETDGAIHFVKAYQGSMICNEGKCFNFK